jgi:hypothetical protein
MSFNQMARDYKSIDLDCRKQEGNSKKSELGPLPWLAAQSIKWGSSWKHLEIVCRTYPDQKYFTQMPIDYKSIDLDYKKQEGD